MASNPRKFSEKIALHNQKQAEETAAFERIMHEVSETRYGQPRVRPSVNHLHPHPPYMARTILGGSLPNVNQMSVNPQMELQQHQHFEDSKHSIMSRHTGRLDSRPRPYDPRRVPGLDRSRGMNHFENPTGRFGTSSYLPLPPENNWRRTNSDSALHQSVMNPNSQDHFNPANAQMHQVRKDTFDPTHSGGYKTVLDNKNYERQLQGGNRPKSCEAPTINIVQSTDHPNMLNSNSDAHMPTMGNGAIQNMSSCLAPGLSHPSQMTSNTGSLPDLTSIQFPSPLLRPVDCDDINQLNNATRHHSNQMNMQAATPRSICNLPPSVLPPYISNLTRPPLSPSKHRRHTHNGPSPLILDNPEHARRMKYPNVTSPKMSGIKSELKSPPLVGGNYPYPYPSVPHTTILSIHNTPTIRSMSDSRTQCNMIPPHSFPRSAPPPPMHVEASVVSSSAVGGSPVFSTPVQQPNRVQQQQPSLSQQHQQQQRQGITSPLTSPTSPTCSQSSPASFSPVTSPQQQQQQQQQQQHGADFTTGSNPALSEAYYSSEMTSACAALQPLQHQLEQFHVVNDNVGGSPSHSQQQQPPPLYHNAHNSLSALIESSGMDSSSYENYQVNHSTSNPVVSGGGKDGIGNHNYMGNMNKIPDITFTGVDDGHQYNRGTSGLLGSAGSCITGGDIPDYLPGEELKVNMGLEGMHLLEDSSNIITDPVVVENSFSLN